MNSSEPYLLQSLAWPDTAFGTEARLFFQDLVGAHGQCDRRWLRLRPAESVSLMSYFNAFHLTRWRQVNRRLMPRFQIKGNGAVTLRWMRLDCQGDTHLLGEVHTQLSADRWIEADIPGISLSTEGFLAPIITASDRGGSITDARYVTDVKPLRSCRLGLVITHFRRHAQVMGAIERLHKLIRNPAYPGKFALKVIDNSQDLPPIHKSGIDIVPSRNLGGSGGFARGLFEFEQAGGHTHCLFMDDDDACPTEALQRTLAVFELAEDEATAVAGAMLFEDRPSVMHENGATFSGISRSIHAGLDVALTEHLARTDRLPHIDYGAWWYFAFPIAQVRHYPFPFFVRGDDISFGLANPFRILTLNGVCTWQEAFEEKASPLTNYLDTRHHLVHLLTGHVKDGRKQIAHVLRTFVTRRRDAMLYESAEAALLAIEDVLQGPDFWQTHMDMIDRRQRIGAMTVTEHMRDITNAELTATVTRARPRSWPNKLAYHLSFKGLLLPRSMMNPSLTLTRKTFAADRYALFRFRKALHLSAKAQRGSITEHDKARILSIMARTIRLKRALNARFNDLSAAYCRGYGELTSRAFWRAVYSRQP
jgi:galactofuranosylgalactofuranosylrhamnosyl-N-acetylglucosaminyl-diphospho-decaprenol beta-1,5/1,6-galactofuranosyltransferase